MLLVLGTMWSGLFATTNSDAPLSSLTAIAAAALLVALSVVAVRRVAVQHRTLLPAPVQRRATVSGGATARVRDPDAAGRPRPRAPAANPAA